MNTKGYLLITTLALGFLLRGYPYLQYPCLLTNDAMRDYQQVQYLQEHQSINWAHSYGRNPTLHLTVYLAGLIGRADTWTLNLWMPQLISTLGILLYYLLLRRWAEEKTALAGALLLAAYGPNIWWSAQAVRETIGLFMLPFILYSFDRYAREGKKWLIVLTAAYLTTLVTHNWTTLITVGMIAVLTLTRYWRRKTIGAAAMMMAAGVGYAGLRYGWYLRWADGWVGAGIVVTALVIAIVLYKIGGTIRGWKMWERKTSWTLTAAAYTIIFALGAAYMNSLLVFEYPPQEYLSIYLLGLLTTMGLTKMKDPQVHIPMLLTNLPLIGLLLAGIVIGTQPDYDPTRIIEYLVYPNAMIAAVGLNSFRGARKSLLIILIILGGLLIYPPVFLLGKQIPEESIFYDIRSHIRYLPEEAVETMKWGQENSYTILSANPNYNSLRDVLYPADGRTALLVSEYDYKIRDQYDKVRIGEVGIGNPENAIKASEGKGILYENRWAKVYEMNNLTEEDILGEYVSTLRG